MAKIYESPLLEIDLLDGSDSNNRIMDLSDNDIPVDEEEEE